MHGHITHQYDYFAHICKPAYFVVSMNFYAYTYTLHLPTPTCLYGAASISTLVCGTSRMMHIVHDCTQKFTTSFA